MTYSESEYIWLLETTYQIDYFQVFFVSSFCHENFLCNKICTVRWVALKIKKVKIILQYSLTLEVSKYDRVI